jgi:ATP-binding protein involved in chromosome partitioning
MAEVMRDEVLAALSKIIDPDKGRDIVSLGMVSGVQLRDGHVTFAIEVERARASKLEALRKEAEKAVDAIDGVLSVTAVLTAEKPAQRPTAPYAKPQQRAGMAPPPGAHQAHGHAHGQESAAPQKPAVAGVKHIVAVASGKGGVGKSTVAANLATALAATGAKVGLLDADVYGPSVPQLMGVHESARVAERKIVPHEAHGVKLMSLGFLTQDDRPVIWRGPMVGQAVKQLLSDVNWGDLDYLLVDLPPGTGDAPLTLIQSIPLSGIVVVTTPQDVALGIATKTLTMFRSLNVPILGIIENMSGFECPNCGHHSHIFSEGGGKATAEALKVPFLGALPLDETVRQGGDDGVPAPVGAPDSAAGRLFSDVARKLAAQVSIRSAMSFSLAVK